jgi:hypothetical protein
MCVIELGFFAFIFIVVIGFIVLIIIDCGPCTQTHTVDFLWDFKSFVETFVFRRLLLIVIVALMLVQQVDAACEEVDCEGGLCDVCLMVVF